MTEKSLYRRFKNIFTTEKCIEKVCSNCGKLFITEKRTVNICDSCLKKKRREKSRAYKKSRKKPNFYDGIPLYEYVIIIEKYNREHKTNYTYGQFSAAVQSEKINIKELAKIGR